MIPYGLFPGKAACLVTLLLITICAEANFPLAPAPPLPAWSPQLIQAQFYHNFQVSSNIAPQRHEQCWEDRMLAGWRGPWKAGPSELLWVLLTPGPSRGLSGVGQCSANPNSSLSSGTLVAFLQAWRLSKKLGGYPLPLTIVRIVFSCPCCYSGPMTIVTPHKCPYLLEKLRNVNHPLRSWRNTRSLCLCLFLPLSHTDTHSHTALLFISPSFPYLFPSLLRGRGSRRMGLRTQVNRRERELRLVGKQGKRIYLVTNVLYWVNGPQFPPPPF